MTLTGWGHTTSGGSGAAILQEVDVPVLNNTDCANQLDAYIHTASGHPFGYFITPENLCAGLPEGGKDSCQGDSGGPGTWVDSDNRAYHIGVVSWGLGCAGAGRPGVYARTTAYLDWIDEKTGKEVILFEKPFLEQALHGFGIQQQKIKNYDIQRNLK